MELSSYQYKLLKKICKKQLILSELSKSDRTRISSLADNGYVRYESITDPDSPRKTLYTLISIEPKGEAEIDSYKRNKIRWLIPVIISLAALIISIFALYKSSQPIEIHISTNNTISENTRENMEK